MSSVEGGINHPSEVPNNVTNLEAEKIYRRIEELQGRLDSLNEQVDKNNEKMERLILKIDNISDSKKKKLLAEELYDLKNQTFKELREMLDIEEAIKNLAENLSAIEN